MKKPYVIGIAGGSASGKSTFCGQLEESLKGYKINVFHLDAYFKPAGERPWAEAPITGVKYRDDNHYDTIDVKKLQEDMTGTIKESGCDAVIVEGHLVLHIKEILELLDLKLYIDCRPDERIVRRLRRNMQWGLSFDEISNVYLDMVRYRHDEFVEPSKWRADLILNGSCISKKSLDMITGHIRNIITQQ